MFYRTLLLGCTFMALLPLTHAQTASTIRSGRPGQAIGANVVGTNILQIQSGLDFAQTDRPQRKDETTLLNNVIRFGLNETTELSAVLNYQRDKQTKPTHQTQNGLSDVQLGFRVNLIDQAQGWLPALGVQTRFRLKSVSADYKPDHVAPLFLIATSHTLSEKLSWGHNLGALYDGTSPAPTYLLVSNLSYSLSDRWSAFIEPYAKMNLGKVSLYADTGLAYLLNKDLQLDLSIGHGDNRDIKETFVSLGVSWRMSFLK